MASAASYKSCRLQVTALVLACFLSLPSISVSGVSVSRKLVLGSQPPRCINRCMNCRPCMAVLVVPPRQVSPQDVENYYLLSWKCRCKNKLFHP